MTHFLQFVANGIVAGSTYGLLAASFALIISVTQRFHIAYVATFAVGAYGAVWGRTTLGLPIGLAIVIGILAAALLGVIIEAGITHGSRPAPTGVGVTLWSQSWWRHSA